MKITAFGDISIEFNTPMVASIVNQSDIDISVSQYTSKKNLTWFVKDFKDKSLELKLKFEFP